MTTWTLAKKTKAKSQTHTQSKPMPHTYEHRWAPTHMQGHLRVADCTKLCNRRHSLALLTLTSHSSKRELSSWLLLILTQCHCHGSKDKSGAASGVEKREKRSQQHPTNSIRRCLAFAGCSTLLLLCLPSLALWHPTRFPFRATDNNKMWSCAARWQWQWQPYCRWESLASARVAELINLWAFCFATSFVELLRFKWSWCW